MKIYFIIFICFLFSVDLNAMASVPVNKSLVLFESVDPKTYIVGAGDTFLFNMIIPNRTINIELISSPTSTILIPGIGLISVKGITLEQTYAKIIETCKKTHEDAYVYVNIFKLRQFKVLVSGNSRYAGMYPVFATYRVSDLIENNPRISSVTSFEHSALDKYESYRPLNAMVGKNLEILRGDSIIKVDLFNYYLNGNFDDNPILLEGDIISILNSNDVIIIGEVNFPNRKSNYSNTTYNDMIKYAGALTNNADLENILVINENIISIYNNNNNLEMINDLQFEYRSDFDESFFRSRNKTIMGLVHIQDKKNLADFLNSNISAGDIIIIPPKVNFIEIIGGVNLPGTYQYDSNFTVADYIKLAGNLTSNAKKNNIYLLNSISGSKNILPMSHNLKRGDIVFVEEKLEYKRWERFKETVKMGGTISTMALVIYNIWSTN